MKKRMFATMLAVVTMATALTGCSTESAKKASDGQATTTTAQTAVSYTHLTLPTT